jgi:hypothetical protein
MKKRGLSQVVAVILIILLVLAVIALIWFILQQFLVEESEIFSKKQELLAVDISIQKIVPKNPNSPGDNTVKLTLKRGAEDVKVISTEMEDLTPSDVVLVSDLSQSMRDIIDPETGKTKIEETKEASTSFVESFFNVEGNKIGLAIYNDILFTPPNGAEITQSLTNSKINLINSINSWEVPVGEPETCICCGIFKATSELENSNSKNIILLSDGQASETCEHYGLEVIVPPELFDANDIANYINNIAPKEHAIESAQKAIEKGINIHAIGYGEAEFIDEVTLSSMVEGCPGCSYRHANLNELSQEYTKIADSIIKFENNFDHLRVVFHTKTESWEQILTKTPGPLEIKTYDITLGEGIKKEDIIKIEVYPVAFSSRNKKIIGQTLDSKKVNGIM